MKRAAIFVPTWAVSWYLFFVWVFWDFNLAVLADLTAIERAAIGSLIIIILTLGALAALFIDGEKRGW